MAVRLGVMPWTPRGPVANLQGLPDERDNPEIAARSRADSLEAPGPPSSTHGSKPLFPMRESSSSPTPGVLRLRKIVEPEFNEEIGHGLFHCTRVSIDSAALVFIEIDKVGMRPKAIEHMMVLALFAGLLHDICRGSDNHAECGAEAAEKILQNFTHTQQERSRLHLQRDPES